MGCHLPEYHVRPNLSSCRAVCPHLLLYDSIMLVLSRHRQVYTKEVVTTVLVGIIIFTLSVSLCCPPYTIQNTSETVKLCHTKISFSPYVSCMRFRAIAVRINPIYGYGCASKMSNEESDDAKKYKRNMKKNS